MKQKPKNPSLAEQIAAKNQQDKAFPDVAKHALVGPVFTGPIAKSLQPQRSPQPLQLKKVVRDGKQKNSHPNSIVNFISSMNEWERSPTTSIPEVLKPDTSLVVDRVQKSKNVILEAPDTEQKLKCASVPHTVAEAELRFEPCAEILRSFFQDLPYLERKQFMDRLARTFLPESTEVQSSHDLDEAKSHSEIPSELLELLKNPSVQALLMPPTKLEMEIADMVNGARAAENMPPKYPTHKAKDKPAPVDFLMQHYGTYLSAGCLYLDQLRAIDPGLVQALKNWDSYRNTSDSAIVKREREKADDILRDLPPFLFDSIEQLGNLIKARKHYKIKMT